MAAGRASVLAEVSRVLVENFMDHRPMLGRVAHIAAMATDTACVIQLLAEDGDEPAGAAGGRPRRSGRAGGVGARLELPASSSTIPLA